MEIGQRCSFLVGDMASALECAAATADEGQGCPPLAVDITITQAGSVHQHGVIQQR